MTQWESSTQYKEAEHLPDIAFQVHVLRQAGLNITQASLMHLNRDCLAPDLSNLFILTDVTAAVEAFGPTVADDTAVMRQLLIHSNPPREGIGRHCTRPYACPYYYYCWQT
ncbi:MAG: hypothetical protein IPM53_03865 [Anaerolineaceae bacterium]|nr:hypothetical protein [Anaerolineaceae bacterium]